MTLVAETATADFALSSQRLLSVIDFWGALQATRFDDEVRIDGARYRPHPNGGGLVASTAFVGSEVFVDKHAMVCDSAIVVGGIKLTDRAVVRDNAVVEGRCYLAGNSVVEDFATLTGMVTLRRNARVGGTARLEGGILLDCEARITRGHLVGPLFIG